MTGPDAGTKLSRAFTESQDARRRSLNGADRRLTQLALGAGGSWVVLTGPRHSASDWPCDLVGGVPSVALVQQGGQRLADVKTHRHRITA